MSRPLQVFLDEADLDRLDAWARARGWTKSQAVRAAVRALTRSRDEDPLLLASGMIEGLPPNASAQFDRYVNESFVAETRASYRTRRRRPKSAPRR